MTPVEAMQETLEAEHAAVFVYGVLGGRLSTAENPVTATRFRETYTAHRSRRDALRSLIADRGETPVPAAAGYDVDAQDRSPVNLVTVALATEQRCAEVYTQLVANSTGDVRRLGIDALSDASLRVLSLGGKPQTWPGAPEL